MTQQTFCVLTRVHTKALTGEEMFVSAPRSAGDLAGVFEYVENTGYFYYYDRGRIAGKRVVAAIRILTGKPDFAESDVIVRWTRNEEIVGLFIRGQLWAAFRGTKRFGGSYRPGSRPDIPDSAVAAFNETA